ncbi:RNA recognition motif-containing protein [Orbilia oligospora]|nr:RNA recognition motif-containing protein [Orbilia oligospora]KAF3246585.1 RNA recognition motif-containing protein [Orbilia oligospora]KAF3271706.1 RNA recognition motif-containing protein [Orbilia oligospora]
MAPPPKKLKATHPDAQSSTGAVENGDQKPAPDADISGQRTVFVRSLNYSTTTDSLSAHFSFIAPLKHATVVIDPSTKASRGFGFVTFTDPADAIKAVQEFNGKVFEGRHIKVEIAQARHRDGDKPAITSTTTVPVGKPAKDVDIKKRNPRLIVRNLPWSVKKPEQLTPYFTKFGKVKEVIIPRKDGSKFGPMAGFAFVTLRKEESARKAIEAINGTEIEGRTVAVDWAVEKNEWKQKATEEEEDNDNESDEAANGKEEKEEEDPMDIDEELNQAAIESDSDSGSDDDMKDIEDEEDDEDEEEDEEEEEDDVPQSTNDTVVFIRNIPFTTDDDGLFEHFKENFGPIRYARVVLEHDTGRPRGTAFVSFYNESDFEECVANAPKNTVQNIPSSGKGGAKASVLQSESLDPTGKYTLDGRVLSVSKAVSKEEAGRLTTIGTEKREKVKAERRRLYLLNEGQISQSNPLYAKLSQADIKMREESYKQRKGFLEKNTSLHLSLVRLSVRNIPRNIDEKDLKMMARKALVEFAKETKEGKREGISKEEARRGGQEAKEEEAQRRAKGKGVVKQAKIVREKSGAGRSMGYGFIEYIGHRWALMGLRWLNGREVAHLTVEEKEKKKGGDEVLEVSKEDKKRRLIVEFALENVQVVQRRKDKEKAAKGRLPRTKEGREALDNDKKFKGKGDRKRKWSKGGEEEQEKGEKGKDAEEKQKGKGNPEKWDKEKRAAQIIARKRQKRRMRGTA